ncbi:MAG: hypothetical protein ACAH83_06445 [Alphaproteobacteria bacterium]
MKSTAAVTGKLDKPVQPRPEALQKPSKGAAEACDKVVEPFAQQTQRPQ